MGTPKIGDRRDVGRCNDLTCKVRVTRTTLEDGTLIEEPYRIFSWEQDSVTKKAISMQIVSFGNGPAITELAGFDPAEGDGLVTAFETGVYFDPEAWDYAKFQLPEIGDYLKLSGTHYEKWTKLTQSPNPALKKGFWKQCIRVYAPDQFLVRKQPPRPNAAQMTKIKAI